MKPDDEHLARQLIAERRRLKRELRQLTNAAIANKLNVSVLEVDKVGKAMARPR